MIFEVVDHKTFISIDEESCKVADALRNKLISEGIKFKKIQEGNVILFKWTETKLTK